MSALTAGSPCTPTSAYPVQPGTHMVGQPGDLGVSGYVSQAQADGSIGYVEYEYALETGFPVAKVLTAAGYYTATTPDNVGISLLKAQLNTDPSSPLYGTANLSGRAASCPPACPRSSKAATIPPSPPTAPTPSPRPPRTRRPATSRARRNAMPAAAPRSRSAAWE